MPTLTPQLAVFIGLGALAVLSALGMLFSRNTVYSALLLVFNFTTVAFIYFSLGAPFIGLAQITVYAGAIMVLFLFVIMMLGTEQVAQNEPFSLVRFLALLAGAGVIAESVFLFLVKDPSALQVTSGGVPVSVASIGELLYGPYLLPFELTSFILLVAVTGAIVLVRQDKKSSLSGKRK